MGGDEVSKAKFSYRILAKMTHLLKIDKAS